MSIVLGNAHSFWIKVSVPLPETHADRASRVTDRVFRLKLAARGDQEAGAITPGFSYVVDWAEVTDEAGTAVPFSAKALKTLLEHPFAGPAIRRAWTAALRGRS